MRTFIKGLSSCAALCLMMISVTHAELPDVALDYAAHPPLALLRSFDVAVVDPDAVGVDPSATHERNHQLFAYVSLGELAGSRHYDAAFPAAWLRERNPAWDSRRIDQTAHAGNLPSMRHRDGSVRHGATVFQSPAALLLSRQHTAHLSPPGRYG